MFDVCDVCHALFQRFGDRSVKWLSGGEGRKLELIWEVWRCASGPAELG